MNVLHQEINNIGDEPNYFNDKQTITVFVADAFNKETVQSYQNNIGTIVELQGFSNGSLRIENELAKAYVW